MDINPYKFTAPWEAYEFANAALSEGSQIACVSMAWLCTLTAEELMQEPDKADFSTVAYWMERFHPFVERSAGKTFYVVLANRCGVEKAACYAGSSTVLKIENGGISLYEQLGKCEERCLVVDLNERPKYEVRNAGR
jgi:protein N-terminal amidase